MHLATVDVGLMGKRRRHAHATPVTVRRAIPVSPPFSSPPTSPLTSPGR